MMVLRPTNTEPGRSIPGRRGNAMENSNREYCKSVALELNAYFNGRMYSCPKCRETCNIDATDNDTITCGYCKKPFSPNDADQLSISDYFHDCLDAEYRVDARIKYKSVRLTIVHDGVNVYIDTGSGDVELFRGMDKARYSLSSGILKAINDEFKKVYSYQRARRRS
jgi:hypothetical protein